MNEIRKAKLGPRIGFLSFIASLGGFLFGYDTAVISGTIGFVKEKFLLDAIAEGWFVSSALVGCIIGVSFAGYLADRLGRKPVMILSAILFLSSAIGCALVNHHSSLIVYRLIGGIGVGVASMISPLYISEVSPAKIRGRLVALYQFAIALGILVAYFANAGLLSWSTSANFSGEGLLSWIIGEEVWRGMFASETIPAVVFMFLALLVPESPRWLIVNNKINKGTELLGRLNPGMDQDSLKKTVRNIQDSITRKSVGLRKMIAAGFGFALFIGIALAVLQQLSGINAIIYYGPRILETAGFSISGALGGQVVIGFINVIFTVLAIWKVDKWGRRNMLIFGVSGVFLTHVVIGCLFAAGISQGTVMLSFILLFIACFAFSYGPIVWIYLSEIFPTRFRGRAMAIATLCLWATNAILGFGVPWLLDKFNASFTFWLFAIFCIPAFYLVLRMMPETKGKTLEEIEKFWLQKKSKKN